MRKYGILLWLIPLLIFPLRAEAAELPDSLRRSLPPAAEELLEETDSDTAALEGGLSALWSKGSGMLPEVIREGIGAPVLLMGVVLLCAAAEDCSQAAGKTGAYSVATMAGVLTVTWIAAGNLRSLLGMGMEAMEQLDVFSKALLPTLAAAVAASGGVVSAGVKQVATVCFAEALITLIRSVLLPLVYLYIGVCAAAAVLPEQKLERLGEGIRKGITWILTGSLVLFTGYLTLSGAVAGSTDALAARLTRTAIGAAVPVVGNIINDAASSILAGAGALKNVIGVAGMLAVLATCLTPFLYLGVQYLLYKAAAFFAGTVGPEPLMRLISALGGAFGLILGMVGTCALLLLISVVSAVSLNVG